MICADAPAPQGQVYSFAAPPPAAAPVRAALERGRRYLQRAGRLALGCAGSAAGLPSGYVVATLHAGRVRFAAPEPIPEATRRCLDVVVRKAAPVRLPAALEQAALWVLRPPAPAPPPAPADDAPAGRRSFAEIHAEVGRHLPALSSCLEELWEERPHAAGTLVLRLTVAASGRVEDAAAQRREPSMQTAEPCLLEVARRLRFAPRAGSATMTYPLLLAPAQQP